MAPGPCRRRATPETTSAPSTRNVVLAVAVSLDGCIALMGHTAHPSGIIRAIYAKAAVPASRKK